MPLGARLVSEPRVHEAELVLGFRRPRIGRRRGDERVARLGVALLRHPHEADDEIRGRVRGRLRQHAGRVGFGRGELSESGLRLGQRGERLDVVGVQLDAPRERSLRVRVGLLIVVHEPERDERQGTIGVERVRLLQRFHGPDDVPCGHECHAEQVVVLRDGGAEPRQRLEREDRLHGHARAERDLRERVEDVLRVRREHARLPERLERAGGVAVARLKTRELEQRLHRLKAVRGGAQELLRFLALTGRERRGGAVEEGRAVRGRERAALREDAGQQHRADHLLPPRRLSFSF